MKGAYDYDRTVTFNSNMLCAHGCVGGLIRRGNKMYRCKKKLAAVLRNRP